MNIIADLHIHTIKSYTGNSTLKEIVGAAGQENISCIAVTDYGPKANSSKRELFRYISYLPERVSNINIIRGIEAEVMDLHSGNIDITNSDSENFDWIIGAYHGISEYDKQILSNSILTNMYLNMAVNPILNTISHLEREDCGFDISKVLLAMKENGKVVEISAANFCKKPEQIKKRLMTIIKTCKDEKIPVCIVSNSHYYSEVGKFQDIKEYLESIQFPSDLVINSDKDMLLDYIKNFKELKERKIAEQNSPIYLKRGGTRHF